LIRLIAPMLVPTNRSIERGAADPIAWWLFA
jgi:hypothetical protein